MNSEVENWMSIHMNSMISQSNEYATRMRECELKNQNLNVRIRELEEQISAKEKSREELIKADLITEEKENTPMKPEIIENNYDTSPDEISLLKLELSKLNQEKENLSNYIKAEINMALERVRLYRHICSDNPYFAKENQCPNIFTKEN